MLIAIMNHLLGKRKSVKLTTDLRIYTDPPQYDLPDLRGRLRARRVVFFVAVRRSRWNILCLDEI